MVEVGSHVIYVDPVGVEHDALVTAVWGPYCINLAWVTKDDGQRDSFGQKIHRMLSLMKQSEHSAHGNYWK